MSARLWEAITSEPKFVHHEENVAKTPYQISTWLLYLDDLDEFIGDEKNKPNMELYIDIRDLIGKRAIKILPKSYKLWKHHWEFMLKTKKTQITTILKLFERAVLTLHKFPRVWIEYLNYIHTYCIDNPTLLRRITNRALESIPVTQHEKLWNILLPFYQSTTTTYIPLETKVCVLRRYVKWNPLAKKEMAEFFYNDLQKWGQAALWYIDLLNAPAESNNSAPVQQHAASRKELWLALANICTKYPVEELGIDWNSMVRAVLANPKKFMLAELEGVLWNQLADSWIRRGQFQLARSVYEESIESVSTVRDFSILLDAYLQFEQGMVEAMMEAAQDDEDEEDEEKEGDDAAMDEEASDWDILIPKEQQQKDEDENSEPNNDNDTNKNKNTTSMADLELALARAEQLTIRRPLLLNRVMLRQNPHDVGEWLKRAKLYNKQNQPEMAAAALEEALQTVVSYKSFHGAPSQLVLELAKIYQNDCQDVNKARDLFDRICNQHVYDFKKTDDLAECYAAWVELELGMEQWDEALNIIRQSVIATPNTKSRAVKGLPKSLRLWDLLLDLEESLGTTQTAKDAYNRSLEQKVATPVHVLNFATFLTEQKYFEEAFTAYERGVEMFSYPAVKVLWKAYLDAFLKRYKGTKIERTRDLFERCLENCPPEECTEFFIMHGKFEEELGLTKRALSVYQNMCHKVPTDSKLDAYKLFLAKTTKYLGVTATRDVYQEAIEKLPDSKAATICLDFAKMESSLDEIDRARAILTYGAQMADPRIHDSYWRTWKEFEVSHGNEETFREMLRIKRSVEASFSTVNVNAAEMSATTSKIENLSNEEAMQLIAEREGVQVQPNKPNGSQQPLHGFVSASKRNAQAANLDDMEERVAKLRKAAAATNVNQNNDADADDDEIDLDNLDDDDNDDDNNDDNGDNKEQDEEADNDTSDRNEAIKDVTTQAVPTAVFGGLASLAEKQQQKGDDEPALGARERLRTAAGKS